MEPEVRFQDGTLSVRIPPEGVDPALLGQPAPAALAGIGPVHVIRIEPPAQWRWQTSDAAYLAALMERVRRPEHELAIEGAPPDLHDLLDLARRQPRMSAPPAEPRPGLATRVGLITRSRGASLKYFVELLGEVVRLLPRLASGRAKVRGAEVLD